MATPRAQVPEAPGNAYDHLREVYCLPRARTVADQAVAERLSARLPVHVWGYLVGAPGFVEVAPDGAVSAIDRAEWPT